MLRHALTLAVFGSAVFSAAAQTVLAKQVSGALADPAVSRAHWGIMVTTLDGKLVYSLNEARLFQPASNAKLFTTAAAMALLGPEKTFETRVAAHGELTNPQTLKGDLYLIGGGDANLSGRTLPYQLGSRTSKPSPATDPLRDLAELADQVAATGLKTVSGDIVGDDTLFRYEPFPTDWAIEDAVWGYGAPISALTVNDNQLFLKITPAAQPGAAASVTIKPYLPYYTVENAVTTGSAPSANTIHTERPIGTKILRLYGSIAIDAQPDEAEIAIEDPAEYAAMALKEMLSERGVTVSGTARAKHRLPDERRFFLEQAREPVVLETPHRECVDCGRPDLEAHEEVLAAHRSAPLVQDVVVTNKESQNLHAELLLQNLGRVMMGVGSTAQGARAVRQFLLNAGIDKDDFVFYDGSGLSGHDLVTPRATAKLLQYAATQPWFAAWKASLPIGGVDGSLEHRFTAAPLKGHVFAKTGTLGEARALSGYLDCASGRTVIFSIFDGNHLPGTSADRDAMDRIVAAIAAAN